MKTINSALIAAFLSLTSSSFASGLPVLSENPGGAGLPTASLPRIAGSEIAGSAEALAEINLRALRAEAAADPDKFIDERTPAEVGLVFGLPHNSEEAAAYGFPGLRYGISNAAAQLAAVRVKVNLTTQKLTIDAPEVSKVFNISSGLPPKNGTPGSGKCFAPDFVKAMHYSSLYNNAPMPNSIFFNGNIAIHATAAEQLLGKPASHGCIRLSKADSKTLYDIVVLNGKANTSICVEGKTP